MSDFTPRRPPAARSGSPDALWRSAARGDREAAERLVECTYRTTFAALVRLAGDPELAADLTQETYRKAWAALPRFRGGSAFTSWLYRIAYTTFLNHVRRPARVVPLDERRAERLSDADPSPMDTLRREEEQSRLRRAVLALPDDLAFAVAARYWGEVPVREIAAVQSVSEVTVRKRLRKALGLLAAALEEAQ
ncbi:MAG: sigma-70 family RNA polymerase sigma factor [Acidobacteriota bacterium]|nr:sigma-70 family RNA polymerase sigma factor [Acidobacteriota bacterium]MDH3525718.1 sigma-70 family RNA polymerase sigma factor [Acidobacteriota bacterium]